MVRGRKPKPTHLKIVTGNPGHRSLNENEPEFEPAMPSPPPHLSDEAKVEWGRVSELLYNAGLLTKVDRAVLAAYCQSYGVWVQAELALADMAKNQAVGRALLIKTKSGNYIQNPLVGTINVAKRDCIRYATELGMTPSARSRINVESVNKATPQEKKRNYFA
jgi:P27 family predicted phage terminase small subunit